MEQMIALSSRNSLSMLMVKFGIMSWNKTCGEENCSGHGECYNDTCICEIQFDGTDCHSPNFSYYITFASTFFVLAFVCLIQLIMCIIAEWKRMKSPSFLRACRVTTQKVLYFVVILASLIRAAYFTSTTTIDTKHGWSQSLDSAYYPLVTSGFSCIVCFWAEKFHLRDTCREKPQFLSKSFLAFIIFNAITYSLLVMELLTIIFDQDDQNCYTQIFHGCYAVLLFIVLIFFLIYGVEVFFKVRGNFISDRQVTSIASDNRVFEDPSVQEEEMVTAKLFECSSHTIQQVNTSQLHQSRLGLVSEAFMLFVIVAFLLSKTLSEFWRSKVPLYSRNWHDVCFRVIEVGLVLWFPCVLWNCMYPEELWILNPRRILHRKEQKTNSKEYEMQEKSSALPESKFLTDVASTSSSSDCWICYDGDRQDAGPLLRPCRCSGDVATVHHDCLRRWLVESSTSTSNLTCKVCRSQYNVEQSSRLNWQSSLTPRYWLQIIGIATTICGSLSVACVVIRLVDNSYAKMIVAAGAVLIIYLCVKILSMNAVVFCQKAKISSSNITNAETVTENQLSTISHSVSVNLSK